MRCRRSPCRTSLETAIMRLSLIHVMPALDLAWRHGRGTGHSDRLSIGYGLVKAARGERKIRIAGSLDWRYISGHGNSGRKSEDLSGRAPRRARHAGGARARGGREPVPPAAPLQAGVRHLAARLPGRASPGGGQVLAQERQPRDRGVVRRRLRIDLALLRKGGLQPRHGGTPLPRQRPRRENPVRRLHAADRQDPGRCDFARPLRRQARRRRGEAAPADRRGGQRGGADRGSRGAGGNSRQHRFLPVGGRRSLAGPGGHTRHGVAAPRVAAAESYPAGRDAHLRPDRAGHRQPGRRARGGQRVRREPGGAGRPLPPRGAHRRRARRLRLGHRAEEANSGAGEADEEMRAADFGRLVALAAIWGASFRFTRIAAPGLGPVLTAALRMLVAGLALVAYFRLVGFDPDWRRWGRKYAFVGLLNSGLPFLLYAYSALYLSAGLMAVLNATAPMWGALFTVLLLGERLTGRRAAGLALGVVGVAVLSRPDAGTTQAFLAIAAWLAASFLYGLAGVYMKRWAGEVPARGIAVRTQVAAGLLMLPPIPVSPPPAGVTGLVPATMRTLGLLCGAVAYLLYFRLIVDIGAAGALTVTYLIPLFGVLWGTLFLGEALSMTILAGGVLVVLGTVFVLRN